MASFKNAMEDLAVNEALEQLERVRADYKQRIRTVEIVAYALNRLPCLYATTQPGIIEQRSRALVDFSEQITETVRRGIQVVSLGDPLHDRNPLPDAELRSPSYSLVKLQNLLNRRTLKWREIAEAVQAAIAQKQEELTALQSANDETVFQVAQEDGSYSSRRRSAVTGIKAYLQRSKAREAERQKQQTPLVGATWALDVKAGDAVAIEQRELESYTLRARLGFSNTMENLVRATIQRQMEYLAAESRARINPVEVVAYALNRLPPLYATSERGYLYLRQYAKAELARDILAKVREAIVRVGQAPPRLSAPLLADKFNREVEGAIADLKKVLQRDDITWSNVAEIVAEVLQCQSSS